MKIYKYPFEKRIVQELYNEIGSARIIHFDRFAQNYSAFKKKQESNDFESYLVWVFGKSNNKRIKRVKNAWLTKQRLIEEIVQKDLDLLRTVLVRHKLGIHSLRP